jgi:pyruvate dehydrogenase E2 component (dihydrolipoamide acetyltransferase)
MSADPTSAADPGAPPAVPLKGIRRTIARRMAEAWQVPVFHLSVTVGMTEAAVRRQTLKAGSLTDVLVEDCAATLRTHPALNAVFADEAITEHDRQHIGLAVATERGVVVPVIRDAGDLHGSELVKERKRMVAIARSGVLRPEHFSGGTFTISNLGMYGIDQFDAILNVPQVAILAVGSTSERVSLDATGRVRSEPSATLTLTCDHRAVDGATAAAFLGELRSVVERQV